MSASPATADTEAQATASVPAQEAADLDERGSRNNRLFHIVWLVLPAVAIGLSLVLEIRDGTQVIVPVLNQPLPELCTFRRLLGIECAGCGLTRSFISIGHLRLADAWHYHPAGLFLYALAAFQLPYRCVQLWRVSRGQSELRLGKSENTVIFALALLLLAVWIVRIWTRILV
ncbi:MAG TPA: DUF2752 domain-containing protein [Pirellulaceae bacterium]|nr:DUF2752 domain-containing protein [Pirellulaceae bacterium]